MGEQPNHGFFNGLVLFEKYELKCSLKLLGAVLENEGNR